MYSVVEQKITIYIFDADNESREDLESEIIEFCVHT